MATGVRVFCQSCGQSYRLDPSKIPSEGKRARCRTCAGVFIIAPPGTDLPVPGTKGPWSLQGPEGQEDDIDLSDLKSRIRFDQLADEDLLLPPGASEWLQASQVPLLQKYFQLRQTGSITPAAAPAAQSSGHSTAAGRPAAAATMCTDHPAIEAKHACYKCNAYYCQHCIETKEMGTSIVSVCPKCKEPAPDVVQIRNVTPFWEDLPRIFKFPFHKEGLVTFIIFVSLYVAREIAQYAPFFGGIASILLWLPLAGYLVYLIGQSAKGVEHPPDFPDFTDTFSDLVLPAIQMFLVTVVAFLPVVLLVLMNLSMGILPWSMVAVLAFIGIVLGLLIYPMVLAILGVWGSVFSAINPVLVLKLIGRIKKEYTIYLLFWYGFSIGFVILQFFMAFIPFGGLVLAIVDCYLYFVTFHMLGRMCYQTEDQLGWE